MPNNPFMKRIEGANIGDSGRASEKRLSKAMGGRLQPASGALASAKGDFKLARNTKFLAEAKSTTGDTLKVDLGWLTKITAEALSQGAKPLLTVSFVDSAGKLRGIKEDWVMLPRSAFDELTGD
jgi:Holliday junction resolvase